jgi:hypothetical protein
MMELESILVLDEKQAEFACLFPSPGVAVSLNLAKTASMETAPFAYEKICTDAIIAEELLWTLERISECLAGKEAELDSDIRIVTDVSWHNLIDDVIKIEFKGKLSDPFVAVTVSDKSESIVSYQNKTISERMSSITWPKLMANLSTLLTAFANAPFDSKNKELFASFAARSFLVEEVERRLQQV